MLFECFFISQNCNRTEPLNKKEEINLNGRSRFWRHYEPLCLSSILGKFSLYNSSWLSMRKELIVMCNVFPIGLLIYLSMYRRYSCFLAFIFHL